MTARVEIPNLSQVTERPAWKALTAHYEQVRNLHLRQLFADDSTRGKRLSVEAVGLYLDYSKNRVTDETLKLLFDLAKRIFSLIGQRRPTRRLSGHDSDRSPRAVFAWPNVGCDPI